MISRKTYLLAVEIIKDYHNQGKLAMDDYKVNRKYETEPTPIIGVFNKKNLKLKIEDIVPELSVRTMGCLRFGALRLSTLEDIARRSPNELYKLRNFGKKCMEEVEAMLLRYGIDWEQYREK